MKIKTDKIVALGLSLSLLVGGLSPSVYALDNFGEVTTPGGIANSNVSINVEGSGGESQPPIEIFSAYVPLQIPIKIGENNDVITPSNLVIVNGVVNKGIKVTDISVDLGDGWSPAEYLDDFTLKGDNVKEIGLKFRENSLQSNGTFPLTGDWSIPKNSYIDLDFGAKIPKQTVAGDMGNVASIGFTLDWSGDDTTEGPVYTPEVPPVVTEQFTVSFITDGNGSITGNSSIKVDKDSTIQFPPVTPNETFVFDKWVNNVTSEEITSSYVVTSDTTVKATFKAGSVNKVPVTFTTDGNGTLEGNTSIEVESGSTISSFPTPMPKDISFEFDKWVDGVSLVEFKSDTVVTEETNIKALFDLRAESPKSWFVAGEAGYISRLSDEYLNMENAPTDLVMPSNLGGSTIIGISPSAFKNRDLITSVVLPKGLKDISNEIFSGCAGITEIFIPEGVTQVGDSAFINCTNLKNIDIPVSVTSIGSNSYSGCTNLKELSIPGSVKTIGDNAFYGCTGVSTLVIEEGVSSIGISAFMDCSNITSVKFPNSITMINQSSFKNCVNLATMELPVSSSTCNVAKGAFINCPKITHLNMPSNMKFAVDSFDSLTSVSVNNVFTGELPKNLNLDTVHITKSPEVMYSFPDNIKKIIIEDGIVGFTLPTALNSYNKNKRFYLDSITFPKGFIFTQDTIPGGMKVKEINIDKSETDFSFEDNMFLNLKTKEIYRLVDTGQTIKKCVIPEGYTVNRDTFKDILLSEVTFPKSMDVINGDLFIDMKSLTSITFSEGVTSIGVFPDNPAYKGAFSGCTELVSVTFPDTMVSIGECAFNDCSNLRTINFGTGLKVIGINAFRGCASLTSVNIPSSVREIQKGAFVNSSLRTVTLNEGLKTIGDTVFNNTSVTDITIPSTVETIGRQVFGKSEPNPDATIVTINIDKAQDSIEGAPWAYNTARTRVNWLR